MSRDAISANHIASFNKDVENKRCLRVDESVMVSGVLYVNVEMVHSHFVLLHRMVTDVFVAHHMVVMEWSTFRLRPIGVISRVLVTLPNTVAEQA